MMHAVDTSCLHRERVKLVTNKPINQADALCVLLRMRRRRGGHTTTHCDSKYIACATDNCTCLRRRQCRRQLFKTKHIHTMAIVIAMCVVSCKLSYNTHVHVNECGSARSGGGAHVRYTWTIASERLSSQIETCKDTSNTLHLHWNYLDMMLVPMLSQNLHCTTYSVHFTRCNMSLIVAPNGYN